MKSIQVEVKNVLATVSEAEIKALDAEVAAATSKLYDGNGEGNDFLGWLRLPSETSDSLIEEISSTAAQLRSLCDYVVCIGIGGSYLGAKAVIEALSDSFATLKQHNGPQVLFAGQNIGEDYLYELQSLLSDKKFGIIVISKSGTTTEPAIAFRVFRKYLEETCGHEEAVKRIYVTTDRSRGTLKALADREGYETFVVPDDVGGRFSVLTAVGLLPIAAAGCDITALMQGAAEARTALSNPSLETNAAYRYAAARTALLRRGFAVELMVSYEPQYAMMNEWWKQLFGESEGKDGKGLLPDSVIYSTDLHSLGQFVQDGSNILFETVVKFGKPQRDIFIEEEQENGDGLNFLAGKPMSFINEKAFEGTVLAHTDGRTPNLVLEVPEMNETELGYLIYFFEKACAVSGYMLGVNPFDQPGVESYKKNMFALLGKPGYEDAKAALEARLGQ